MQQTTEAFERRTTKDAVFDHLLEEIGTLKLLPGTKLSEVEIARRFGVSRQPVRDAFSRLEARELLLIRPQKATVVRGFSMERIRHARFVRLAVELEVLHAACAIWDDKRAAHLEENLKAQEAAISTSGTETFHALDYQFHKMICELGGHPLAFVTIAECKARIDRLCMLSLGRQHEAATLLEDHREIARALSKQDAPEAKRVARRHLARLDDTISAIHRDHSDYFE